MLGMPKPKEIQDIDGELVGVKALLYEECAQFCAETGHGQLWEDWFTGKTGIMGADGSLCVYAWDWELFLRTHPEVTP